MKGIANEMQNCTFNPKFIACEKPRKFEEFMEDQSKHIEKRNQQMENLKEKKEIEEKMRHTVKPTINKMSQELAEKRKRSQNGNVKELHLKLYEGGKKKILEIHDTITVNKKI